MHFYISEEKEKLQIDRVVELLHNTYWAAARTRSMIEESIKNSVCYGVYDSDRDILIGFARVLTDYATTYYLCDVVVDEECRGNGIGKALLQHIVSDTRYEGFKGILLTKDAHGFYKHYGFQEEPVRCMLRSNW